ncbi:hypothetical protein [Roseiconus lacunae]|uniref:hypothetical protein n=1 Tax=Roseiconus lacunae TaxID=2605694 RepID=UPI00193EF908
MTFVSFAMLTYLAGPVNAQVAGSNPTAASKKLVTKVYDISNLLESPRLLSPDQSQSTNPATQGNNMGAYGGGQAPVGGGGMFRIPDSILPQFGGGMGGMGGGMGGMGGGQFVHQHPQQMTREALKDVIITHVSGDTFKWMETSGEGGDLSIVGPLMIVTQSEEAHQKIAALLDLLKAGSNPSPTIQLEIRLVQIEAGQTKALSNATTENLVKLANEAHAARISLRCDNHRIAEIASGLRRSYVMSLTPVVGSNDVHIASRSSAYRPEIQTTLLGLFGRVKPAIAADGKQGRIQLGIQMASAPEEVLSATFGTGQTTDRVEIETATLETTVSVDADKWTMAGTVAITDATSIVQSGQALPHVAILMQWTVVE